MNDTPDWLKKLREKYGQFVDNRDARIEQTRENVRNSSNTPGQAGGALAGDPLEAWDKFALGAGFLPVVGEGVDAIDFAIGGFTGDTERMLYAGAGLGLAGLSGAALRRASQQVGNAADAFYKAPDVVKVRHYGDGAENLDVIDPSFHRSGQAGAELGRSADAGYDGYQDRSFFYNWDKVDAPEARFRRKPFVETHIPRAAIADNDTFMSAFERAKEQAIAEGAGVADTRLFVNRAEKLLQDEGYEGWENAGGVIAKFTPTRLVPEGFDADAFIENARANKGITADPRTGRPVEATGRYNVSPRKATETPMDDLTPEGLRAFMRKWNPVLEGEDGNFLGAFFDPDANRWDVDVSRYFDNLDEANDVGIRGSQKYGFDNQTGELFEFKGPDQGPLGSNLGYGEISLLGNIAKQGTRATHRMPTLLDYGDAMDAERINPFSRINEIPAASSAVRPESTGSILDLSRLGDPIGGGTTGFADVAQGPIGLPEAEKLGNYKHLRNVGLTGRANRERMLGVIDDGMLEGGHLWYDTDPIRQLYRSELGDELGDAEFFSLMQRMGPTSAMSPVPINIRRGTMMGLFDGDVPPGELFEGTGFGHPSHNSSQMPALLDLMETGSIRNPLKEFDRLKIRSYVNNLSGNADPATIDRHALAIARNERAAKLKYIPSGGAYTHLDQLFRELGQEVGLTPSATQAAAWVGGSDLTGVRDARLFSGIFDQMMRNTGDKLGLSPAQVSYGLTRRLIPLY